MILPDSVDAQVTAGIAFAPEPGSFQQADRCGVVGNTRSFEPMQSQRGEAVWYQRTHRGGHIAFPHKRRTDPVSDTACLSDSASNVGQRQSADHGAVLVAKDQKRIRQVAALVLGISLEPAPKGTTRKIVRGPGGLPWREEGATCLAQRRPFGEVAAVRSTQCDAGAGNTRHRFV